MYVERYVLCAVCACGDVHVMVALKGIYISRSWAPPTIRVIILGTSHNDC